MLWPLVLAAVVAVAPSPVKKKPTPARAVPQKATAPAKARPAPPAAEEPDEESPPPVRAPVPAVPLPKTLKVRGGDAPTAPRHVTPRLTMAHAGETKCGSCHSPQGWTEVKFNHDRTGFPLQGRHARITCQLCHRVDFQERLPRACAGCHDDPHAGDLGTTCDTCHEATSWRAGFAAEDHRRTAFPLVGAHAAVPCLECHPDVRERRFSRPSAACEGCHSVDRKALTGTPLDHDVLGFGTDCGSCHGPARFSPASFPGHDACFTLSSGPHSGIGCTTCHTSFPTGVSPGTCNTRTAGCTGCHEHQCAGPASSLQTDKQHASVAGYQCKDRKCYECHQLGEAAK